MSAIAEIGRLAVAEHKARKERAAARTSLSALRRRYMELTGEFFDPQCCEPMDELDQSILAAIRRRAEANKALRAATSKLGRAIRAAEAQAGEQHG